MSDARDFEEFVERTIATELRRHHARRTKTQIDDMLEDIERESKLQRSARRYVVIVLGAIALVVLALTVRHLG